MRPRVAVLSGFGVNCESETMAAFEMAGASAERVHVNRLVSGEHDLADFHVMAVPGGFSFGDHLLGARARRAYSRRGLQTFALASSKHYRISRGTGPTVMGMAALPLSLD